MFEVKPRLIACPGILVAAWLALIISPLSLHADAWRPADPAAEMTIGDIVQGLKTAEGQIRTLSCTSDFVTKGYFRDGEGNPPQKGLVEYDAIEARRMSVASWTVESSGKSWCKRTGKSTFTKADGSQLTEMFQCEAAFDGREGRHVYQKQGADGVPRLTALVSDGFVDEGPSPLEFTTHWLRQPISTVLEQRRATIVGRETWEDRPVIVVETEPVKNRQEYATQFWIDASRGFIVVRRRTLARYGADRPWQVHLDADSLEHEEVSPGIWLPRRLESKRFAVPAQEPENLALVVDVRGRYGDWEVNREIPESTFELKFPAELPRGSIRYLR